MKRIFQAIAETYRNQLKCNHLKNQKFFTNILPHLSSLYFISNILKKTMSLTAFVFPKL